MPLKRELFKELNQPKWFNEEKSKLYLYLFFIIVLKQVILHYLKNLV